MSSLEFTGRNRKKAPAEHPAATEASVVCYPTAASRSDGLWRIPIHGWIYTPAEQSRLRRTALRFIKHMLRHRVPPDDPGLPLLHERASAFLAGNQRNAGIQIRIGDETFPLRRSRSDGHFQTFIKLSQDRLPPNCDPAAEVPQWLEFSADLPGINACAGRALLLPPTGLSVISDIDDTLKVTEVAHRRRMLRNTFLRDFVSVPDMAALFRFWQTAHNAAFHYVSASPWHLFSFLGDFLADKGFPAGTFHLRDFRLVPGHVVSSVRPARRVKIGHIRELLRRFPTRRFILVGDSGESDPETYGRLFRAHAGQIEKICIRNITAQSADDARWEKSFSDLPSDRWQVFTHPEELL